MASIVKDERNAQRRRDWLLELSRMDIDDDFLTDVITKVRERNARTHLLPTPQLNGQSHRLGLYQDAEKVQAYPGAGPTKRHSNDHLRSFEILDMEAKSREKHLLRNGSVNDKALRRTAASPEKRDSESIVGRTAAYPEQRDSGLIGSNHSPHSNSRTRNDHVSRTPSMRSTPSANGKTSRAEMRSSSLEDNSTAWARPGVSPSAGSRNSVSANPSPTSRAPSSSTAGNKGVSKSSGFHSTLNPKTRNDGQERAVYATKQGGSNAIGLISSLHSSSAPRHAQLSRPDVNPSTLHPKENKQGYGPAGRANASLRSKGTTSHKQVSKPAANHTKLKPKIMNAGRLCAVCVAKQGGPSAVGIDVYLDSQSTARKKVLGVYKIFQRKPKDGQQKHTCAGCEAKQNDPSPSEGGSNSALLSQSTGRSKESHQPRDMLSKLQAIQKEGVTLKSPPKSPSIRSSNNVLPNNSRASFAPGVSKTTVSTASLLSKDSERSKHSYKSRGIQSKSQVIRREGVNGKSPDKYTSVNELRKAFSNQSIASQAPTEKGSKGRDTISRSSVVSGHGEAAKTLSPRADLAVPLHENGSSRLFETTAGSLSTLSSPSGSTSQTRYSILASDRLNPVNPGDRFGSQDSDGDYSSGYDSSGYDSSGYDLSGDESSGGPHPTSSEVGKVVDSVRSTARDILSSDVENAWMGKDVLKGISEWKKASVDAFIESVCDKLDELDDSLATCDGSKKAPPRRWLPKFHLSVKW